MLNEAQQKAVNVLMAWRDSPLLYIKQVFNISPQRLIAEPFKLNNNITWQQYKLFLAIERAIRGGGGGGTANGVSICAPTNSCTKIQPPLDNIQKQYTLEQIENNNDPYSKRISIRSGHGTGKTTGLSLAILWALMTHKDCQVACTSPTGEQLFDVLWKELSIWIQKMPDPIKSQYLYETKHIRMVENPNAWFARARTARKEQPEALAGVHAPFVVYIVDEGSGVADEIYNTAEGSLTGENYLVIVASNPTRNIGYFYDTFNKQKGKWQNLHFNSLESPLVNMEYVKNMEDKHGKDSDEYKIRVLGEFPKVDSIDEKGYTPLFKTDMMNIVSLPDSMNTGGELKLGIDCAGEGRDKSVWVLRNRFRAEVLLKEKTSTPKSIANKTLLFLDKYKIRDNNVYVDNFGEGANVARELAFCGHMVNAVNVGDRPLTETGKEQFLNRRSECFWRSMLWLRTGGELVKGGEWDQLLVIKYTRQLKGLIQIQSKKDILKERGFSPDVSDAFSLTFLDDDFVFDTENSIANMEDDDRIEDRFSVV